MSLFNKLLPPKNPDHVIRPDPGDWKIPTVPEAGRENVRNGVVELGAKATEFAQNSPLDNGQEAQVQQNIVEQQTAVAEDSTPTLV